MRVNAEVEITEIGAEDKPTMVEFLNDADIYANSLLIPSPYAMADADRFLQAVEKATTEYGHPIDFAIRFTGGKLIGGIGFQGFRPRHRAELGYWLAKPYWGRGIMTATVGVMCAYAMQQWGLVRISARVFEDNARSCRVLEKNHFEREGILRKHDCKDGRYIDCYAFALVRDA